jgi:metal-responsive CopG/Arc/MetJ family transcriptional regulator
MVSISDIAFREIIFMGRPPMQLKATVVRLPEEALERIEALVGKNRMAEFIRDAVERELKRRERKG